MIGNNQDAGAVATDDHRIGFPVRLEITSLLRYPIVSVEDPVAEDEAEGFRRFTQAFGARVQVVGDDFLVTDAARVRKAAASAAITAALIKPNQAGTLTETQAALEAARTAGRATIVSARSERMAKWNETLRIEEALGAGAGFAGSEALAFRRPRH